MTDKLQWMFEMVDRVSGPAKRAEQGLGNFIQTVHSGLASLQLFAQGAVTAGRAIASGLEPAITKEKTLGAFETMFANSGIAAESAGLEAGKTYAEAVAMAAATPYATGDVVRSFKQLLVAQFQKEDLSDVFTILGDAASMSEAPKEALNTIIMQMGQMRNVGKATMEDLRPIFSAAMISQADYLKKVADRYDITIQKAQEYQSAGKVSADVATWALLATMVEKTGGNMAKASKQVGGLISTIGSRPAEMLERIQDTKGYDALRDSLAKVADTFNPASISGGQLADSIQELGSGILERVASGMDAAGPSVQSFLEGFTVGLGGIDQSMPDEERMKRFAKNMEEIGSATGTTVKAVAGVTGALADLYDWLNRFGSWTAKHPTLSWALGLTPLGGFATQAGYITRMAQTEGTGEGTTQQRLVLARQLESSGFTVPAGATTEQLTYAQQELWNQGRGRDVVADYLAGLKQEAADRVQEDPIAMAASLGLPAMARGGRVTGPTIALIGESGAEDVVPAGRGGGLSVDLSGMIVHVGDVGGRDATAVGRAIGDGIQGQILAMLERFALQSGRI